MNDIIEKLSHPIPCFEDVCDNAQTMHDAVEYIKVLEDRLEIYPINLTTGKFDKSIRLNESCDGIACRDEAIKSQDKHIKVLEAKINAQADYIMISNRVNNNLKKQLAEFTDE